MSEVNCLKSKHFFSEQVDDAVECISIRGQQILLTDLQEVKCRLVADNRKRRRIFTFDHIFAPSDDKDDQVLQAEVGAQNVP